MGMTEELASLGKQIAETKQNLARYEGRTAEIAERLKSTFDVSTVEEGEKLIEELTASLEKQNAEITKDFEALKETFDW
jgi:DNA repair exonuclease SbcCD ATPase subunit